jgi:hypothetical protein
MQGVIIGEYLHSSKFKNPLKNTCQAFPRLGAGFNLRV